MNSNRKLYKWFYNNFQSRYYNLVTRWCFFPFGGEEKVRKTMLEVVDLNPGDKILDMCCGSGAVCWFSQSSDRFRQDRLKEASQTGAQRLVTVCHYCSQTFAAEESQYEFRITNYVNLVAEAMGICQDDTFKRYAQWGNLERILKDADAHIAESPFEHQRIIEVLQAVFIE